MEKRAFALIVLNKWYEICAVHVFHNRESATEEMWDEVVECQQSTEVQGKLPYIEELEDGIRLVWEGDCYYWHIVEDTDYEVNNP